MTEKEINYVCKKYDIKNYTINSDMSIDVDSNVYLYLANLHELPLNFNRVNGIFDCGFNYLKSLKGAPNYLSSIFSCNSNELESFQYCPESDTNAYFFQNNNIRTFDYFPNIKAGISLRYNPVDELWSLFKDQNHVEYFNELDIIQEDGNAIILDRLNYFLQDIGKKEIYEDDIKKYKVII